jgi:PAS domain-containing protein
LKQVQNALAAREGQLRAIMDGVPAPVAYIDRDERCLLRQSHVLQYFGLTSEQVSRMRFRTSSAMHLSKRAGDADARVAKANRRRSIVSYRGARRASLDDDSRGSGCGGFGPGVGAFVLMNDIHGLKQAQEALRASEAELRLIMDNVPARVFTSIATIVIDSSIATTRNGWARAAVISPGGACRSRR